MSGALVATGGAHESRDLRGEIEYCRALADAGLLPASYRKQPANLLLIKGQADALGIHLAAAISGIHIIDGKPSISANLMSALVRRAGHRLRVTGDDKRAVAEITRRDDPDFVFRSEWTIERAATAGLIGKKGGSWEKYPAAMLKARAISEVARDACPEALAGVIYTPEELGADVAIDADGDVVVHASPPTTPAAARVEQQADDPWGQDGDVVDAELVIDEQSVLDEYRAEVEAASSRAELRDLYRRAQSAGVIDLVESLITDAVAALPEDTEDVQAETNRAGAAKARAALNQEEPA